MDTGLLKGFAAGARVDLIKEVGARLDVVLASGSVARAEAPGAVAVPAMPTLPDVAAPWLSRLVG